MANKPLYPLGHQISSLKYTPTYTLELGEIFLSPKRKPSQEDRIILVFQGLGGSRIWRDLLVSPLTEPSKGRQHHRNASHVASINPELGLRSSQRIDVVCHLCLHSLQQSLRGWHPLFVEEKDLSGHYVYFYECFREG